MILPNIISPQVYKAKDMRNAKRALGARNIDMQTLTDKGLFMKSMIVDA